MELDEKVKKQEIMQLADKIKFMRMFRKLSQEDMAHNLKMAPSGYAKIEHGETDPPYSRLLQIAKTLEISLPELVGLNDKSVLNIINTHDHASIHSMIYSTVYSTIYSYTDPDKLQHENEKLHLLLNQKEQEVNYLKEIISLMQNK